MSSFFDPILTLQTKQLHPKILNAKTRKRLPKYHNRNYEVCLEELLDGKNSVKEILEHFVNFFLCTPDNWSLGMSFTFSFFWQEKEATRMPVGSTITEKEKKSKEKSSLLGSLQTGSARGPLKSDASEFENPGKHQSFPFLIGLSECYCDIIDAGRSEIFWSNKNKSLSFFHHIASTKLFCHSKQT